MRVCLLNDSFPPVIDGVANTVMNYARILTESGMAEALVGTPRYPDADYTSYPYRVVPYQSFDTTGIAMGYRAGNPLAMGAVREMAEFAPDLIHTHCPVSSTIMARILRNEMDAPIVLTYHTKYDVDLARAVKAEFLRESGIRTMLNNIEACDEVWTVSEGAGESLKALGFQGEYRVMSNGVDFQKGRVAEDKVRDAVKGYDLPEGIPVFLFVGRIMKYKGLPLILDGLARYAESGADFRMVFVGGGADRDALISEAKAAGFAVDVTDENGHMESGGSGALSGRCIFTGPVYDRDVLRAWNTRADLFLFPSTYDTNGIVVREAAACGLASVLIKGSCAAEGITDHRNGYLIEENGEALAALLMETGSDLDAILASVSEETKQQIINAGFAETDKKDFYTTRAYIFQVNEDGDKVTAIALFYAPEHGEFYDRKIKLSKADAQAKGVQAGAFVPALMKYDKEMHYFDYKKLV